MGIGPDWKAEGVVAFVTNNSFLDGVALRRDAETSLR